MGAWIGLATAKWKVTYFSAAYMSQTHS